MTITEQWVPALDVYKSADEMREAQKRGGDFRWGGYDGPGRVCFSESLDSYTYLIGSDPQEPVNRHTMESRVQSLKTELQKTIDRDSGRTELEKPMQTEPDRLAHLIDCARQVLDGKTLQFEHPVDGSWCSVTSQHVSIALSYVVAAMNNTGAAVRIKPGPVVSEPIYFGLAENGQPIFFAPMRDNFHTHKLAIIKDDGKVSAVVEELGK